MTLRALYQQIGQLQRHATALARNLEFHDRLADMCGHPQQHAAASSAREIRARLSGVYTRIHALEALLPTADLLSEQAYNRALMLGLTIDAAEAERVKTYRATAPAASIHLMPTFVRAA